MSAQTVPGESRFWLPWRASVNSLALMLSSAIAGAALVAISWRFGPQGPVVLLALALAPFVALLIAIDLRVGAGLVLIVLPFNSLAPSLGSLPLQPLEVTLLFAAVVIGLIRLARGYVPLRWAPTLWIALAALGWSLVSLQSAIDIELGIKQVGSLFGGVLVISMFLSVTRSDDDVRILTGTFVAVGGFVSAFALVTGGPTQSQFSGAVISGRLQGLFDEPNQLGSFCALVLFLAVGLGLGGRSRAGRVAGWVGAALLMAGLMLSLSRGAWIGTALAGLYLVIALPQARKLLIAVLIPFLMAVLILGPNLSSSPQVRVVIDRLGAFTAENPYDNRPTIYREARRQIVTRPWLGYGPGSFPETSRRSTVEATTVAADHAHNIWLTWAAEMGIPALMLLLTLMGALAVVGHSARRTARSADDPRAEALVAGMLAALLTVVGQGVVDYTWRNQAIFFGICAAAALLLAAHRHSDEPGGAGGSLHPVATGRHT